MITSAVLRRSCLVCGETDGDDTADGRARRCVDCGFGWTTGDDTGPAPTSSVSPAGPGYGEDLDPASRRFVARRRLDWLLRYGPVTSLLDVGCGAGYVVEAARRAGIDAVGVDSDAHAVRYARNGLGVPVTLGSLDQIPTHPKVDAISAFRVLEHLADPHQFLRLARRRLTPAGLLAVEVSNAAATRRGAAPLEGRWGFSPDALSRLVGLHGFTVLAADTPARQWSVPPAYRRRHPGLALADLRATGSLRLVTAGRGDVLRLIARRTAGAA